MQFNGEIVSISENGILIQVASEENQKIVLDAAQRLSGKLLTIHAAPEHLMTAPQKKEIRRLLTEIAEKTGHPVIAMEKYLCKRLGIENIYDLMKEEASMAIQEIKTFCDMNDIDVSGKPEDEAELEKHINASNKYKTCVICGQPGESIDLKDLHSKAIYEWKMGYAFLTLCTKHYMELTSTGVGFFKKYHLIKRNS